MTDEEIKHSQCDACGHDLYDPNAGYLLIGCNTNIKLETPHSEHKRLIERFGKDNFTICWCCWIRSLGVKEQGK